MKPRVPAPWATAFVAVLLLSGCGGEDVDASASSTATQTVPAQAGCTSLDPSLVEEAVVPVALDEGRESGTLAVPGPDDAEPGEVYRCQLEAEDGSGLALDVTLLTLPEGQAATETEILTTEGEAVEVDAPGTGAVLTDFQAQGTATADWICGDSRLSVTLLEPRVEEERAAAAATMLEALVPELGCA